MRVRSRQAEDTRGQYGCGLDRDVNAARNVLQTVQGPGAGLRSRSVRVAAQLGREDAVVFSDGVFARACLLLQRVEQALRRHEGSFGGQVTGQRR